jgi:hypothetical protein
MDSLNVQPAKAGTKTVKIQSLKDKNRNQKSQKIKKIRE